jgi:hypothetical protein
MTSTYVYCLVASSRAPRTTGAPGGLPGFGRARALEVDRGLFAIVADAPARQYGEAAINKKLTSLDWVSRAATAHNRVVEYFIDADAILPMKLLTLFANDARALENLRGERTRLSSAVRRVARHREWGVRVLLDRDAALAYAARRPHHLRAERGRTPGAAYLSLKKTRRDASVELATHARKTIASLFDRLARKARLARRRPAHDMPSPGGALLLDAAFLVSRSRTKAFRSVAAKEARVLAPFGYAMTLTGPWPPYTFAQE